MNLPRVGIVKFIILGKITFMRNELNLIANRQFDLLVIGGGITGAGVAHDAAARGLKVALVEKKDFASGTSGISSKLVHGGLRYLEHGQISLVYESLQERGRLLRNAPHLVKPLPFLLPVYADSRVPAWKWRAGLKLYDLLAGFANIAPSKTIAPFDLRKQNLPWAKFPPLCLQYFDAQMDDSRLCIEVIEEASQNGAAVANHLEVTALDLFPGRLSRIQMRDCLTGEQIECESKVVLNATGPWSDQIRKLAGETGPDLVKPTKGVHIIMSDVGLNAAMLLLHPKDGRVFFIIPWLNRTLVGTTDTEWDGQLGKVSATAEDINYLVEGFAHFLKPAVKPEVIQSFAGLRPLFNAEASPSSRSREFKLHLGSNGLFSAVGGKYTTYRAMAEEITNALCKKLGNHNRCTTMNALLPGGFAIKRKGFEANGTKELGWKYGLNTIDAMHLLNRYGKRAGLVAQYCLENKMLAERIDPQLPDLMCEFAFHRDFEMARLPDDFLYQRTRLGYLLDDEALEKVRTRVAPFCNNYQS